MIVLLDCSDYNKDEYRDAFRVPALQSSGGDGLYPKQCNARHMAIAKGRHTDMHCYLRVQSNQKLLLARIIGCLYWFGYNLIFTKFQI